MTILSPVFHRILDFKDGAGFLSWPQFFLDNPRLYNAMNCG